MANGLRRPAVAELRLIAQGRYLGARIDELRQRSAGERILAALKPAVLFGRSGEIDLYSDRLLLTGWSDPDPLVLRRDDVTRITRRFIPEYRRSVGGPLDIGKPLILDTTAGSLVLLVDDTSSTLNPGRGWETLLDAWLAGAGDRG